MTTADPSSFTVFTSGAVFVGIYAFLGAVGIAVCLYSLGMLVWLWRCQVTLFNFRGCLLFAFAYFGTGAPLPVLNGSAVQLYLY